VKRIITIGDVSYMLLREVSAKTEYTNDELKSQYSLADTILRNGNKLFICMTIIDAEFEMI
jgi:TolB-like protein